jgi:hypothetical protein
MAVTLPRLASTVTPDLFRGPTGGNGKAGDSTDSGAAGWMPEQVRHDEEEMA